MVDKRLLMTVLIICIVQGIFAQTWKEDSLIVRQILDTNGLMATSVEDVCQKGSTGRIGQLKLSHLQKPLEFMPASIGKLTGVNLLSISGTYLNELPPELGKLVSLRFLDISGNRLSRIPAEICNCRTIELLYAQGNQLTEIPEKINDIKSLQRFQLDSNRLKSLPATITDLVCGPDGVVLCGNDSMIFTPDQKLWWNIADYAGYRVKYCSSQINYGRLMAKMPPKFQLLQVVSAGIVIVNSLPGNNRIRCSIYNLTGTIVLDLSGITNAAGMYSIVFNKRSRPSPGAYVVRIVTETGGELFFPFMAIR
jgi:Leucine-rich repeat (LRR) protein